MDLQDFKEVQSFRENGANKDTSERFNKLHKQYMKTLNTYLRTGKLPKGVTARFSRINRCFSGKTALITLKMEE
jgi:hypothetical protein